MSFSPRQRSRSRSRSQRRRPNTAQEQGLRTRRSPRSDVQSGVASRTRRCHGKNWTTSTPRSGRYWCRRRNACIGRRGHQSRIDQSRFWKAAVRRSKEADQAIKRRTAAMTAEYRAELHTNIGNGKTTPAQYTRQDGRFTDQSNCVPKGEIEEATPLSPDTFGSQQTLTIRMRVYHRKIFRSNSNANEMAGRKPYTFSGSVHGKRTHRVINFDGPCLNTCQIP